MLFEACDKRFATLPHSGAACAREQRRSTRTRAKHTQDPSLGKLSASQHVLINLLRAICQEIFSFKQPSVNRDEAPSMGQGTAGT